VASGKLKNAVKSFLLKRAAMSITLSLVSMIRQEKRKRPCRNTIKKSMGKVKLFRTAASVCVKVVRTFYQAGVPLTSSVLCSRRYVIYCLEDKKVFI